MRALKLRNDQAFTFLLICKTDPVMRKCINKDIQKLICSMILIDYSECFHPLKMVNKSGKMFWKQPDGRLINPCPYCLAPCIEVEDVNFDENRFACHLSCETHGLLYTKQYPVPIDNDHKDQRFNDCQKCLPYGMCIPCFKRKEKKYQF